MQTSQMQKKSTIARVGDFLSAPFEKLPRREDERRSTISAIFLLMSAFSLIAEQTVGGNTPRILVLILIGAYFLARTRWYKYATLILVFALTFPSYVVALNLENPEPNRVLSAFVWVAVPILITSLIYSVRATIAINLFNVIAICSLPFIHPGLTFQLISGAMGFIILLSIVLLVVTVQRNRIELDRQTELWTTQKKMEMEIAERIRSQEERENLIKELESRNAELTRFNYTISHELKSPIVTIKAFIGSVENDLKSSNIKYAINDLRRIENAADKMQETITDLLELSRAGYIVNQKEEIVLQELVQEALETVGGMLRQKQITVHISPSLTRLYADRSRLLEVFENLLSNAAKYTGAQKNPVIEIGKRENGTETIIYVKDNGMGVEPQFHTRIFGLFEKLSANSDGTGIGLALIKRIVEVHGGRIWVESEGLGKGSTFCFTIPNKAPQLS